MQAQTPFISPAALQFPLQELEQIESTIHAMTDLLTTLQDRHNRLISRLDQITSPAPMALQKLVTRGLAYRGTFTPHGSCIAIYVDLLRRLWTDFPAHRDAMAQAMAANGRIRTYVAKTPVELFPGCSVVWARRYSRPLVDDWHVDTNLNPNSMIKILRAAVTRAGLHWGKDVSAYWRATFVPVANA